MCRLKALSPGSLLQLGFQRAPCAWLFSRHSLANNAWCSFQERNHGLSDVHAKHLTISEFQSSYTFNNFLQLWFSEARPVFIRSNTNGTNHTALISLVLHPSCKALSYQCDLWSCQHHCAMEYSDLKYNKLLSRQILSTTFSFPLSAVLF